MKAVLLTGHGGLEMLQYGEAPDPTAGFGEVVVDVHAASVNAADYKVRLSGGYTVSSFPHILGRDFSGVVSVAGPGVRRSRRWRRRVRRARSGRGGRLRRKARRQGRHHRQEARQPRTRRSRGHGANQPHGAVGARRRGQARRRRNHLIQGGAGGVAGFAIQFAKHLGATVITTASPDNHDYVRSLGADRVIDYHSEDFTRTVSDCDVVFDTVGGEVQVRSYDVLKPGGRLVWIAPAPEGYTPTRTDVHTLRPNVRRDRPHLERMLDLLAAGAVWPPHITRYPLADAPAAHRVSEARHLRGKLVFEVR